MNPTAHLYSYSNVLTLEVFQKLPATAVRRWELGQMIRQKQKAELLPEVFPCPADHLDFEARRLKSLVHGFSGLLLFDACSCHKSSTYDVSHLCSTLQP